MSAVSTFPAFNISIQSGTMAVREALKKLMEGLTPLSLDVEEAGTVELVMAEALNNIVEHAYPEGDPEGPINITCSHARDGLHMTVIDAGRAMPDGRTPLGTPVETDVALNDMPEGGFGWFLIKDLAKDVTYDRINSENHLSLRLAVAIS
ncbi:ATP-binding protein [uncultured Tateyamaria sp.]|uniref:ATP-binding protein n=1 Tax=uncultured Tateyamaria sp. TaxID=455651 RepID=UPI00260DB765|nr:ATP-binding protein [uncultured Tateyamaria sp.]